MPTCHASLHLCETFPNPISLWYIQKRKIPGKLSLTIYYFPKTQPAFISCYCSCKSPFLIHLSLSLNVASFVSFRAQLRYSILCEGFSNYIHWAVLLCAAAVPSVSPWPVSATVGITLSCNYLFTRLSTQLTCKIFRGGAPMFPCRPTRSNPPTLAGVHSKRFLPCYAEQATQVRTGTTPKWLLA